MPLRRRICDGDCATGVEFQCQQTHPQFLEWCFGWTRRRNRAVDERDLSLRSTPRWRPTRLLAWSPRPPSFAPRTPVPLPCPCYVSSNYYAFVELFLQNEGSRLERRVKPKQCRRGGKPKFRNFGSERMKVEKKERFGFEVWTLKFFVHNSRCPMLASDVCRLYVCTNGANC